MRRNINPVASQAHLQRAFTLVEVLIASTISSILLAATITSFLFLGRSGTNLAHYSTMEAESRRSLEYFARDVRQASGLEWKSPTHIELTFKTGTAVEYVLGGPENSQLQCIKDGITTVLVNGIIEMHLIGYNIAGAQLSMANLAAANKETKQLQLTLHTKRKSVTAAATTNSVLSARFILRNKKVTA